MPRGRPCKYGDRGSSGKCPSKPTITKKRLCKYCKHGERTASGKCPRRPSKTMKNRSRKNVKVPLSMEDKELLARYIQDAYGSSPNMGEALEMLDNAMYEPAYKSAFSGKMYEDRADKEYYQVQDKIDAFFKYGDRF